MEIDISSDSESASSSPTNLQSTTQPSLSSNKISATDRISELNQIDTSISHLLSSASTATSVLSNLPSTSSTCSSTLPAAQATFQTAAATYFSTLSSIEVRLRRQVYALEEAGLIHTGDERDARRGRTLNVDEGRAGSGGGGPLDPSWLNARASDGVEIGMKREMLRKAKKLLEEMRASGKMGQEKDDGDVVMSGDG